MSPESAKPQAVEHAPDAHRFQLREARETAFLSYRREGNQLILIHTEVPESLQGRGIAGRLARFGLEYAKREGLKVVALCPFVKSYLEKHPELA
jgi:predicted GNAT family acetyltransferase